MKKIVQAWTGISLVQRIVAGLVIGALLGMFVPSEGGIAILGDVFVGALKAIAPLLVFFLVISSLCYAGKSHGGVIRTVIIMYMFSTFLASIVAVTASSAFPVTLTLVDAATDMAAPQGVAEVLRTLLMNVVTNPVQSLVSANYIGILVWAVLIGIALRKASDTTKQSLNDISAALSKTVTWIIQCAPFGIMGLVANAVGTSGIGALLGYAHLLVVLLGAFFIVALVMNPLIVFLHIRRNPYPLVFATLRESGLYAFFTRSSAANIPVNLSLCKRLGLNEDTYSISIPLGATINMSGAAITIAILSLAAAHTLGIEVDILMALLLSIIATVGACGASGVAGGSLLLIPVACASFGISNDIAMQVVGVGFIIGVLQDSCETALNSSSDVLFTATAEFAARSKEGTLDVKDMVPQNRA